MKLRRALEGATRCFVHLSAAHNALFILTADSTLIAFDLTGGQSLGSGTYHGDQHAEFFTFAPMRIAVARGQHASRIRTPQGDRSGLLFEVIRRDAGANVHDVLAGPDTTAIHIDSDGSARALRFDVAGALASYPLADTCAPGQPGAWSVLGGRQLRTTTAATLATFAGEHLFAPITCRVPQQRPGYLFVTAVPTWPVLDCPLLADAQAWLAQPGVCCYRNFHFFFDPDSDEQFCAQPTLSARRIDQHGNEAEGCWGLLRYWESHADQRRWLALRREMRRYAAIDASITEFRFPPHTPVWAWNDAHVTMFRDSLGTLAAAFNQHFTLRELLSAGVQLFGSLATLHHLGYVHGGLHANEIVEMPTPVGRSFAINTLERVTKIRSSGLAELASYDPQWAAPEVREQIASGVRPAEVLISPAADAWALGAMFLAHTRRLQHAVQHERDGDLAAQLIDIFRQVTDIDPQVRMSCAEVAGTLAFFS